MLSCFNNITKYPLILYHNVSSFQNNHNLPNQQFWEKELSLNELFEIVLSKNNLILIFFFLELKMFLFRCANLMRKRVMDFSTRLDST